MSLIDANSVLFRMVELRYAWILQRKSELNEATFKIAGVYGSSIMGLGLIEGFVIAQFFDGKFSKAAALSSTSTLLSLLYILSGFSVVLVLANVLSWFSYRQEEFLLEQKVGASLAKPPSFRSMFKWFETYLVVGIIAILIGAVTYTNGTLFPLISAFKKV